MPAGALGVHGQRGDGHVGLPVEVRVEQLRVVHAVEVIAGEDQVVVGLVLREVAGGLAHGVGRALEPGSALRGLLGGQDLDEAVREAIHPVGAGDVAVERRRVELREHEDAPQVGVQAVADRHVDQAVLAADRHRRLRAMLREREEAAALAAAEDECEGVPHHQASVCEAAGRRRSRRTARRRREAPRVTARDVSSSTVDRSDATAGAAAARRHRLRPQRGGVRRRRACIRCWRRPGRPTRSSSSTTPAPTAPRPWPPRSRASGWSPSRARGWSGRASAGGCRPTAGAAAVPRRRLPRAAALDRAGRAPFPRAAGAAGAVGRLPLLRLALVRADADPRLRLHGRAGDAPAGQARAECRGGLLRRQLRRAGQRRWRRLAASTRRSSSTARTPTSAAGCTPRARSSCAASATCTLRPAVTARWAPARSSPVRPQLLVGNPPPPAERPRPPRRA